MIKEHKYKFWVGVAVAVVLLVFFYTCASRVKGTDLDTVYFFAQLFSGASWPSLGDTPSHWPKLFPAAAAICVMLNIVPVLGIVWILRRFIMERSDEVKLASALQTKDTTLRAEIEGEFLSDMTDEQRVIFESKLDKAFEEADKQWKRNLTRIVGPQKAKSILSIIENQTI
jgi:hypothetical protein